MIEMVERVAKAIWDAKIKPGGGGRTMMPWPACPEHDWCVLMARAAIEAMREPTDAMILAGAKYHHDNWRESHAREDTNAEAIWQDMIDSALSNEGTKL